MKGVTFGTLHSYDDFSLILSKKTIGAPKAKTAEVDVPESDGVVDLTEFFGEVKYNNRELEFEFSVIDGAFDAAFSSIQNVLHGQRLKITLDSDPDFYYMGRVYIDEWASSPVLQTINVKCDCEPYKYKLNPTSVTQAVTTTKTTTFANLRKSVSPTFTIDAEFNIVFGEISITHSAGTFTVPEIQFVAGNNSVTFNGTGNVTVQYQERGL